MRQRGFRRERRAGAPALLTSIRMAGRNRKSVAESPHFAAQAVEKSAFEERRIIWFLLRRIWISLRRIWFLLRPIWFLLRSVWFLSPLDLEARALMRLWPLLARLDVIPEHRVDLRLPALAVEDAVVADAGLQMMG